MQTTTAPFAAILGTTLGLILGGPASSPVTTGGAGNTGVAPPATVGGVGPGARDLGPSPITRGNEANPSNSSVPGTGSTSGGPSPGGRLPTRPNPSPL